MKIRRATDTDIPFLVEALIESEASGTQNVSYRTIFSLNDHELKDLLKSILSEAIEGCGWSPAEFLVAEEDREAIACCAAWIEGAGGLSSTIIKSQLLIEFLGKERWDDSRDNLNAASQINIKRTPGVLQIESVYTSPRYRGKGLSGALIREHLSPDTTTVASSAEIQVMKNNAIAIKAYERAGFTVKDEKYSPNVKLRDLLPYHTKIMMGNY